MHHLPYGDFSYSLNVAHLFMNDGAPGISGGEFLSLFLFFAFLRS